MRRKVYKIKSTISKIMTVAIFIAGVALSVYIGIYQLFIRAVLNVCAAYDGGALTATLIGISIIKIVFAPFVIITILSLSILLATLVGK